MPNSKDKGSNFERKIANTLSKKFESYLGIKTSFRRNPDSGSFFGGTNQQRTQSYSLDYAIFGDLICPKNFKYSIECKHYKSPPTFNSIINQDVPQWDKWLKQAAQDATNSNKISVLITKYNNVDEVVFLDTALPDIYHIKYKNYHIHLLSDWLKLSDEQFFI